MVKVMHKLIVLVIVIVFIFFLMSVDKDNNLLAGLWKADSFFGDNAKVDSIYLFIESTYSPNKTLSVNSRW